MLLPVVSKKDRGRLVVQITGKHILLIATVLSLIAFVVLLVWKLLLNGNISDEALWLIGVLEIVLVMIQISLNR